MLLFALSIPAKKFVVEIHVGADTKKYRCKVVQYGPHLGVPNQPHGHLFTKFGVPPPHGLRITNLE